MTCKSAVAFQSWPRPGQKSKSVAWPYTGHFRDEQGREALE